MIAQPPGLGLRTRRDAIVAIGGFSGALVTSAVIVGLGLSQVSQWLGWNAPRLMGYGAALTLLGALLLVGLGLPSVGFEVPTRWIRLGPVPYAIAFGLALGGAVLTLVPSPGVYLLLLSALVAGAQAKVVAAFVAFALGRAVPSVTLGLRSLRTEEHFTVALRAYHSVVPIFSLLEVAVLAGIAVVVLMS